MMSDETLEVTWLSEPGNEKRAEYVENCCGIRRRYATPAEKSGTPAGSRASETKNAENSETASGVTAEKLGELLDQAGLDWPMIRLLRQTSQSVSAIHSDLGWVVVRMRCRHRHLTGRGGSCSLLSLFCVSNERSVRRRTTF